MNQLSIVAAFEPCRSLAFGGIGVSYAPIGTPIDHPSRMYFVQNLTDETVWFSTDGIHDHFPLPAGGFFLFDVCSDKTNQAGALEFPHLMQLYVKRLGVPTAGTVYLSTVYGRE
jgi:hypothetical protein